jgi:cyclic pyranopterin phosphate synthase
MSKLSHYDETGAAHMVDVSAKASTRREAVGSAFVSLSAEVLAALPQNPKGNPLCHPLPLSYVDVSATVTEGGVAIRATAATTGPTGVEMEALTAASVAALTIYDMCKALDKGIVIRSVQLESKTGGKSGDYTRG